MREQTLPPTPLRASATTRREFLQCSLLGGMGLTTWSAESPPPSVRSDTDRSVILILNVGGPSHVDMWDPKPDAPAEIRGPLRTIRTTVPGIFLSELCPRQARIAHRLAFVRSCHHEAPAVHYVGWQLAQTGHPYPAAIDAPHVGSVVTDQLGARRGLPPHVVLPGIGAAHTAGQSEAFATPAVGQEFSRVPAAHVLFAREPARVRERYGASLFGQNCLAARCLVGAGVRFVTIRTCEDYQDQNSWDVHGDPPFATVQEMKQTVAPMYDRAFSALVEDLASRGMLDNTLVCCVAEFGRTPRLNPMGGRDHWPRCWTTTFAGGGICGGQVLGASDAIGSEPAERPVTPAEIVGTMYHYLGLEVGRLRPFLPRGNRPVCTPEMRPLGELF
ncbi:MAG: DUF1501 domain-containing protein [Pirellulaceae bacterium]